MLTEESRPPVEFIKVCLFRQSMAKDLGTSTFFPAETWKGLKKKSTLYKEEGEPI